MEQDGYQQQISENLDQIENLLEMLRAPETPMGKILQQLESLPETSSALLNRANSSEFALKHQICRVSHAIAVLGMQRAVQTVSQTVAQKAHATPPASHVKGYTPVDPAASS